MVAGALIGAIGAYVVQVLGGRALGPTGFAPVSVIWAMLFIGFTIFMLPIEQMVIRRVTLAGGGVSSPTVRVVAMVTLAATVLAGGLAVAVRQSLFVGDWGYVLVAVALFPVSAVHVVGRGLLAGRERYTAYGAVVAGDALSKVVGTVLVVLLGLGGVALCWVLALTPVVVVLARPWRTPRDAVPAGAPPGSDRRFLGGYLVGTAASQVLLASGPLVLGALGASAAAISVYFVTTTLFRGPLSVSYNLMARLLPSVTRRAASEGDHLLSTLVRRAAIGGGVAAGAAGAGAMLVGPWIVQTLYGQEFRPTALLAGLAAAAVVVALAALVATQVLVGRGHTGRLALAWVFGLIMAVITVISLQIDPTARVATALLVGETAALLGLVVASGSPAR
ncbi:MAG: hypothetical protein WEA29_02970 [Acidimicrobiia bacterium]